MTVKSEITVAVNGQPYRSQVEPRLLLVHYLRDVLDLTGTHIGCNTSKCGACTVLLDGEAVKACTVFAVQADGSEVTTIEGLAPEGSLHPIQEGFWEKHGLQCGFCTPGMIMASYQLLKNNPNPTETEIRKGLEGNICRCTGYQNIVRAVQYAAEQMRTEAAAPGRRGVPLRDVLVRQDLVIMQLALGEPDVDLALGVLAVGGRVHQVRDRKLVGVGVRLALVRVVAPDRPRRRLVRVGRADQLADDGDRLDPLEHECEYRAGLHERRYRVVDGRPEALLEIDVMLPVELGVHPDHLEGDDLQQSVLEACQH